MKKRIIILVGVEIFTSKKGVQCMTIHTLSPINKRESHIECAGQMASSYFVPDELRTKISVNDIGKEFTIYTYFTGNKDNLADIMD